MKISIFLTLCTYFFEIHYATSSEYVGQNLNEYLWNISESVRQNFSQKGHTTRGETHIIEMKQFKEVTIPLGPEKDKKYHTTTLLDTEFLTVKNKLLSHDNIQNNHTMKHKIISEFEKDDIIYTKMIRYKQFDMLLIAFESRMQIYRLNETQQFFVHTISTPDAADAQLFVNNDKLYLVIIKNKVDILMPTSVYQWLETHFDEIQTIFITGASHITTFKSGTSQIIVILQHSPNRQVYSTVCEFNFGKIRKLHHLHTISPIHAETYALNNKTYVIIFEKSKTNKIYSWNEKSLQLLEISVLKTPSAIEKSAVIQTNNTAAILLPLFDRLQVYLTNVDGLKLEREENYISNYSNIINIVIDSDNDSSIIYLIALTESKAINISAFYFRMNIENYSESTNHGLRSCFNDLEHKVYNQRKNLREFKTRVNQIISAERSVNNSTKNRQRTVEEEPDFESNLKNIIDKLKNVEPILNTYKNTEDDNLVIYGNTIINGLLEAVKLIGKEINVKKINGHKWTPEQWLLYTQSQTITGPVEIKHINASELVTSSNDNKFKGFLTKHGNQEISGKVMVTNLIANTMFAQQINNVTLESIYMKNNPEPVRGLKTFKNINANKSQINLLNGKTPDDVLSLFTNASSRIVFDTQLEVENLTVEWIDDVHWNTFKQSVFKIGEESVINGNLKFPTFKTKTLTLNKLNGVKVEDFLTTSTDQIIQSEIQFGRIFAENITSKTTNNMNLKDAVRFGDNRTIKGSVKFDTLYVRKDLELIGKLDKEFFLKNGDHIIGTNVSDLLQTYKGTVKIKGNLYLNNLILQPESKLYVSNDEINPNISETYWTKSTHQTIPVRFQAQNGITAPYLLTDMINNIKIGQYMLNNNEDKFKTSFHFTNISVSGNVILNNSAKHTPDLMMINQNSVKTNGSFIINGKKTYTDTLTVKHFITNVLNGTDVYHVLTKNTADIITGKKHFENVIVKGNLTSDISPELVNGINIKQFVKNVIYVDQPQDLNRLHFKNITISNLYVSRLNHHPMNEFILNLEKVYSSDKINNLHIEGNLRLKNATNIDTINNIKFQNLTKNGIHIHSSGGFVQEITFLGHLKVHNLVTRYINDVNLTILTSRQLHRHFNQTVTAPFSFTKIKAENIVASKINDISVKNLVDISSKEPQTIYAPNGLQFSSAKLIKSIESNGTSPCDFKEALWKIKNPPSQDWNAIVIRGNVTFMDPEYVLYRVFTKTVTKNSKNIIYAPVIITHHILARNVLGSGYINGVNLEEIIEDAVVADTQQNQVITGPKIFARIQVKNAQVVGNTDSPIVNNLDIPEIDKAIVRKNQGPNKYIRGKKTFFGGLETNRFYSDKVANTKTDNIVNLGNLTKIPKAIFESLKVENNLNLDRINFMPFSEILQKRLLTDKMGEQVTTGLYYFDNLEIENMETPSINNIKMDDVVFDLDQQNVSGAKRFFKPVEIYGNAYSDYINGIDIIKTQKKTVVPGKNLTINGNITILRPSVIKGNINATSINGYPIANLKEILSKGATKAEESKIRRMKDRITHMVKRNHRVQNKDAYRANIRQEMPSEYMYLEKSDVLQISVPNTVTAKTMTSKGYVLMHITGEESGEYCGLPKACKCPVQYTMEISPEHSVAVFLNKDLQRTFSYSDENMIIHFKTNSISTDAVCRTYNARVLNEVSMMSWITLPTDNTTGTFYQYDKLITGYISGVEFFTLNGKSYAIIGRFYDPTADTHNLDCIVIRFSEDKSKAHEIQRISTSGLWSMYLFHTAQGVTLVVGNVGNVHVAHLEEELTVIYRFNENNQQFETLRTVPSYGSFVATGVVLRADSLIILAHKVAPLQVLKYNHFFDNYYFYQSFTLESPVQGISVFYTGGFGISDAYLCIVTRNENYFIYSFQFIEGWKIESSGELEGLRNLIPFKLNKQPYLIAPSTKISSLLTVVKHGSV